MQDTNQQIYFVIFMGTLLAFLLVGFILGMIFFYQRRRQKQERELIRLKEEYEQEVLAIPAGNSGIYHENHRAGTAR